MKFLQYWNTRIRSGLLLATVALVLSACAGNDAVAAYPYPPYPDDPAFYGWAGIYDDGWVGDGWYHDHWHHGWADHGHWGGHGVGHVAGHFGGGHGGGHR